MREGGRWISARRADANALTFRSHCNDLTARPRKLAKRIQYSGSYGRSLTRNAMVDLKDEPLSLLPSYPPSHSQTTDTRRCLASSRRRLHIPFTPCQYVHNTTRLCFGRVHYIATPKFIARLSFLSALYSPLPSLLPYYTSTPFCSPFRRFLFPLSTLQCPYTCLWYISCN
ncbi:hypothetical protein CYLTODRAFT_224339 [Cylindrobasidium torrendii FP15055 ss-10]|uniref:Uncharacterized protein n=1 Tax=Cylindrobasidium torrendii FP15055 ss-10 TaxID=1314674 RepID=A0A0D7AW01_9AGAR|nr:hypothetical protein CYLTODRAFT_224339 [Cylindrobasidium torrendii FP15055 ss-10]